MQKLMNDFPNLVVFFYSPTVYISGRNVININIQTSKQINSQPRVDISGRNVININVQTNKQSNNRWAY